MIAATMFHAFTSEPMIHIVAPLSLLLIHTLVSCDTVKSL